VRFLIVLVALALVAPSPAAADRVDRINRLAVQMWGPALQDVCPDGLTVDWTRQPYDVMGRAWERDTMLHEAGHVLSYDHDYRGRGRIMSTERMLSYDEVVFPSGRVVGKWRGVHPWCQPGGGPRQPNVAYASGTISHRGVT
jgi:hypothetical protein